MVTVVNRKGGLRRDSGQTLVVAILILGVLLILGIAFASIINRNITETGRSAQRTVSGDLAQAGVKFAHDQMLRSALGADWRPQATLPDVDASGFTKDPDALFLRPGTGLTVEVDPVNRPGVTVVDLGGPDYFGPYSRIGFGRGRALVRVRYTPSAYDAFEARTGALRQAGKARGHIVIESVGRAGALDDQGRVDPSRLLAQRVQVTGFAAGPAVREGLGNLKAADALVQNSRRLIAFASIGLLESARYITNKNNETRPIEIGFPVASAGLFGAGAGVGAVYEGFDVRVPTVVGADTSASGGLSFATGGGWENLPGGGSLWVNGQLMLHGRFDVALNAALGESWHATDGIRPANAESEVVFEVFRENGSGTGWSALGGGALAANLLDSRNPSFTTLEGILRDGREQVDAAGFTRSTKRKEAPSVTATDPETGLNRYRELTQKTGPVRGAGLPIGQFGYGEGVYVDSNERANRPTTEQRTQLDPVRTLPNDWLNPNNAASQGWQGPYYVPRAPYVQLLPDGFVVTRDSSSRARFWRDPETGEETNVASVRFWVREVGGQVYIANDLSNPGFNPLTGDITTAGQIFNGVLFFEGDVRVRGVIPTDVQLSLVSMGTIYVEGSIVKGTYDRWTRTVLTRPSRSLIALMARDFVALNLTQVFAPAPGEALAVKSAEPLPNAPSPLELSQSNQDLSFTTQFLLRPVGNDPSVWPAWADVYRTQDGRDLTSYLLVSASSDDGGPSFVTKRVEPLVFDAPSVSSPFLFPRETVWGLGLASEVLNEASGFFPGPGTNVPALGLGDPSVDVYPRFETLASPLVNRSSPAFWNGYSSTTRLMSAGVANPEGPVSLAMQDPTLFRLALTSVTAEASKNFLIGRTAVTPFDVRIEAVMYAENGSFFVIPGNWFNPNAEDTRTLFEQNYTPGFTGDDLDTTALDYNPSQTFDPGGGAVSRLVLAQRRRYERTGNAAEVPFYAEPLAVRVSIVGSVSENMPAPMSSQAEWLRKWGWIPRRIGGSGLTLPAQWVDPSVSLASTLAVPNLTLTYDPVLATAAVPSSAAPGSPLTAVRTDSAGRVLPPAPRLPVSPTLAYFGDINP